MDIDTFGSKPLTLDEAVHALKDLKRADSEVWVVVRSLMGSKKVQAGQG